MGYKAAIALGLLPQLLSASVVCSFSMAASEGDTCESFATSWGQTAEMFQELNPSVSCPILNAGQSYCIIGTRQPRPPLPNMSQLSLCDTIAAEYGISEAQFKDWNPSIDSNCSNLWLDYYVCVHVPGATTTTSSSPEPTFSGPQPQMPGIVSNCKTFYKVKHGDDCYSIETVAGITLAEFRSWNAQIDASCSNLWVDYYVCTGV
ncbi:Lysine Motif is a small domain involved in binding peptidoglycan [Aspergillus parasiticus SU-1]|uniref:Lysine Motif is a small domain involved in binding peptidoglycan n=1 Tax=Aspergillus parasiticus (strain ATCC 56775 / NRRL 5862 / SRRC 143 / SU-1) TaxID=1403190 RepID=A0A0F0IEA5_ASPPU|nr:Lysine Motif is a small domain involved in binding peptidoglycan [Aspergillus parasiticus SU-1]